MTETKRTMEPFRDALNRLIEERGLMQLELATEADVSESAISLYRSGKRNAKPATIAKIARALGLDPDYFIEYRRWHLHRLLDRWIDENEAAVEFLLEREAPH